MTPATEAERDRLLVAEADRLDAEIDAIDRVLLRLGAAARELRNRKYAIHAERSEIRDIRRDGADAGRIWQGEEVTR